jgi:hypothetical protein
MSFLRKLYRRTVAWVLYLFIRVGYYCIWLFGIKGYKRSVVGKCVILAPSLQMQTIIEGISFLEKIDLDMFKRLTTDRKYFFWYHKQRRVGALDVYSITDHYLCHGKEGVVICLVQSVLDRAMIESLTGFSTQPGDRTVKNKERRQQLFEFIKKHLFSPQLVKQYQKLAEK